MSSWSMRLGGQQDALPAQGLPEAGPGRGPGPVRSGTEAVTCPGNMETG